LPFEKKRMVKHFQIETWLDLTQISIEPDIENQMTDKQTRSPASDIA
jgi:protein tyrosine phosphatase